MKIKEINIPFTNGNFWIEIEIDKKWSEISFRRLYTPSVEARRVLGSSDSQALFCLGFLRP